MFTQPVSGEKFFGRSDVLEVLGKRVNALKSGYRQNIALTGPMMCGKSSILQHFLRSLNDKSYLPIYLDVTARTFSEFAGRFMETVLFSYLKAEGIECRNDLSELLSKAETRIPKTVSSIKKIRQHISARKNNAAYRDMLEIPNILKDETGRRSIIIMDEFHNLEHFKISNPFMHLGKVIMVQKNTMFIVSSSQRHTIRNILTEKLSLLFGNFEIIEVSGFDTQTAREFLKTKIGNVSAADYYLDYVINLAGKNPFYIDVMASGLSAAALKSGLNRVNLEVLKEAMSGTLFHASGPLNQHFTNHMHFMFDKKSRKDYIALLIAISQGKNKLRDLVAFLKTDEKKISRLLEDLVKGDVLFKSGVFYGIDDPLFEFWLKNVYARKERFILSGQGEVDSDFKTFVENDIEEYLIEYSKAIPERFGELLRHFNGELIESDNKLRKLPKFVKVDAVRFVADKNYMICQTARNSWIFKINKGRTEESDIVDFIQDKDCSGNTNIKRVLVSLDEIEANALLLAKEKRIWVWDIKKVNSLFRLYHRQSLVL